MSEFLTRLCTANRLIETSLSDYVCSAPSAEDTWRLLSPAMRSVIELGSSAGEIISGGVDSDLRPVLDHYVENLKRLQRVCAKALAELQQRRMHLWQQEQNLRNHSEWQSHF